MYNLQMSTRPTWITFVKFVSHCLNVSFPDVTVMISEETKDGFDLTLINNVVLIVEMN